MPRFVILEHDWPTRHWDLLLEAGEVLQAWRLLAEPVPGSKVSAERNADHRLVYLDYEGSVPGCRGRVTRWDWGEFEWQDETTLAVRGRKIVGTIRLRCEGMKWGCEVGAKAHG